MGFLESMRALLQVWSLHGPKSITKTKLSSLLLSLKDPLPVALSQFIWPRYQQWQRQGRTRCPKLDQSLRQSFNIQMTRIVLIRRKLNTPPTDAWHSSGRYKSLVIWSQKYPSWSKLGSHIYILFSWRRLSPHLALAPMSHQEIKQSEPFQGAPEPGFCIAKNEFSRQDITSIYFMSHLYFLLRLFWIIVMVCKG